MERRFFRWECSRKTSRRWKTCSCMACRTSTTRRRLLILNSTPSRCAKVSTPKPRMPPDKQDELKVRLALPARGETRKGRRLIERADKAGQAHRLDLIDE